MDEVTRLQIEIDHSLAVLQRIAATQSSTETDRRYARILKDSIATKREKLQRLESWLSIRH